MLQTACVGSSCIAACCFVQVLASSAYAGLLGEGFDAVSGATADNGRKFDADVHNTSLMIDILDRIGDLCCYEDTIGEHAFFCFNEVKCLTCVCTRPLLVRRAVQVCMQWTGGTSQQVPIVCARAFKH